MAKPTEDKEGPGGQKTVLRFVLASANRMSSQGTMFSQQALEGMLADFQKPGTTLLVTESFTGLLGDMQGIVTEMEIIGEELWATVEIPHGVPAADRVLDWNAIVSKAHVDYVTRAKQYIEAARLHSEDPDNNPPPDALQHTLVTPLELAWNGRIIEAEALEAPTKSEARIVHKFQLLGCALTTSKH